MGPEWYTQEFQRAVAVLGSPARFDNKPDAFDCNFPGPFVGQPSVGQGALRPTRVYEVEGTILVAHVESRSLHDVAVKAGLKSSLLASSLQEVMDCSHLAPEPSLFNAPL